MIRTARIMIYCIPLLLRLSLALGFSCPAMIGGGARGRPRSTEHRRTFLATSGSSAPLLMMTTSDDISSSSGINGAARNESTVMSDNSSGIGGLGGLVFDVNKLKRNLLQETVQLYKKDMLALLSHPQTTEQDVTLKLGALVQGSAVRTTTDSNLLDNGGFSRSNAPPSATSKRSNFRSKGSSRSAIKRTASHANDSGNLKWTLAYTSKYTHLDDLLRPPPVEVRRRRRGDQPTRRSTDPARRAKSNSDLGPPPSSSLSPAERRRSGKQSLLSTRFLEFYLEGLAHEQPMTIDTRQYAGGLVSIRTSYRVCGLTRTNLVLQKESESWLVLGRRVWERRVDPRNPPKRISMQLVYLDVDLAVLAETTVDTSLAGAATRAVSGKAQSPVYSVYTKNPAWADAMQRRQRKLRRLAETARRQLLALLLKKMPELDRTVMNWKSPEDEVNRILQELQLDTTSKLKVLKLGNWTLTEDDAWDGSADPFVHLSADERQEILKKMKIRDVELAGSVQRSKQRQAQGHWLWRLIRNRGSFKKPRI
jgi:hypothetical protein